MINLTATKIDGTDNGWLVQEVKEVDGETRVLSKQKVFCSESANSAEDAIRILQEPPKEIPESRESKRQKLKAERNKALNGIVYDFQDGRVIQVRESDYAVIQAAISRAYSGKWVMLDNTVAHVTADELKTALVDSMSQYDAIFNQYMDDLEALNKEA